MSYHHLALAALTTDHLPFSAAPAAIEFHVPADP
jgi:hypothetical protein